MSYAAIGPSVYEVYQQETPWHAGAKGWWGAPIPGWGQNPNLLDRNQMAIQGLGCAGGCGCKGASGVGAYYPTNPLQPIPINGGHPIKDLGQDVVAMPESGCPAGYHQGTLNAGGVALETPVCVKKSFTALHVGLAALAGFVVAKIW